MTPMSPAGLLNAEQAPEPKPDDPQADATMRGAGMIIIANKPKRGRQRKPAPAIPNRIVTYTPKRKRDAWTKYLRLTGNAEEPHMTASPRSQHSEVGHAAADRRTTPAPEPH